MPMFFIAILAPTEINVKVTEWKHYMQERYGCKVALRSPAHITLIPPFTMDEVQETNICSSLTYLAKKESPFDLILKNFAAFPPRVIYVHVQSTSHLTQLKSSLENYLTGQQFPIKKEERPFHPHVTIATRDLTKTSFKEAWQYFKTRS
jgi:2'-5' RNA ligase